ncbi:hypothetical protein OPT61_g1459 [Boeremia exigua]|uniref:Uncharacterized protein n=1 Tax=Boeremia exigua TaxID=749465 RepID=A0ACC2IQC5_9PLEO|nr:hypothetical protein OPT61_g1459 [Boeremia exigua]
MVKTSARHALLSSTTSAHRNTPQRSVLQSIHSLITMHLYITTLFLAALASAQPPPLATSAPHTAPATSPLCIEPYTGNWQANYNTVFFHHPADPHFTFTIATRYVKFYPPVLATWLEEKGFHTLNASAVPASARCGWTPGETVIRNTRQHGSIHWKRAVDVPSPPSNSSRTRDILSSPLDNTSPHPATLSTIRAILHDNSPDADRYYAMTVLLGTACGTLAVSLLFYALAACAVLVQKRRRERSATNEDVELQPFKPHGLSGAGMRRFEAEGGKQGEEGSSEAPPVYSVDGAGR